MRREKNEITGGRVGFSQRMMSNDVRSYDVARFPPEAETTRTQHSGEKQHAVWSRRESANTVNIARVNYPQPPGLVSALYFSVPS